MFIEILNYGHLGCKAKCPTCPQVVSGPNNGPYRDLMFVALNKVKNKFNKEPISFSFQNDIADLPDELEKLSFDIGKIDYDIGCNIKIPFDTKIVSNVFSYLESRVPNITLSLFLENRGFLPNYRASILTLIEIFVNSKISDIAIACHNNSMRVSVFDQSIEEIVTGNIKLFKEILLAFPTNHFQKSLKENLIPFPPENYKQFISSLSIHLPSKNLKITERILSFEEGTQGVDDLISFYRDHFETELKGETFDKEKMLLAFTSIGVRVNHRSIDIRNPFLWLSYDEFFELLEKEEELDSLCLSLVSLMKKTTLLSCKIKEINYETIHDLADARKQLVL